MKGLCLGLVEEFHGLEVQHVLLAGSADLGRRHQEHVDAEDFYPKYEVGPALEEGPLVQQNQQI